MPININNYVNITSSVGGSTLVAQRQLIGRVFTDNYLLPQNTYMQFSNAAAVGSYFGTSSTEYLRASYYFGFINKQSQSPQAISFARSVTQGYALFTSDVTVGAYTAFTSITNGSLTIVVNGISYEVTGMNFSTATSLANVATIIQTALQASQYPWLINAVVTYNSTGNYFQISSPNNLISTLSIANSGSGTDIAVSGLTDLIDGSAVIDLPAAIYGQTGVATTLLSEWQAIVAGELNITLGGVQTQITGLNFSTATSLGGVSTSVVSILTAAIVAAQPTNAAYTTAVVSYNATNNTFNLTASPSSPDTLTSIGKATANDIAPNLGWATSAVFSDGNLVTPGALWENNYSVEVPGTTLGNSAQQSNNFGSFIYINKIPLSLVTQAAQWAKDQNVMYQYYVLVSLNNTDPNYYVTWAAALKNTGATGAVIESPSGTPTAEYPEMLPMAILASINFNLTNSAQNFMFYQSTLTPSVTTDALKSAIDAVKVNYYGQTQNAGQLLSFFQNGVLFGLPADPPDMTTFANEQWLKTSLSAALMNLLLSASQVPANRQGVSMILGIMQPIINQAVVNGVISSGKTLNQNQKLYITQISGDENSWITVQNSGYWIDCVVAQNVNTGLYEANYTLIYSKDDVIRLINGTDILI